MTPLRLLLIEDREDDAALVVRELSQAGYDVMSARVDTPEALTAALTRQPWDVAVADYTMPRFRGAAALALLRRYDVEVPFIFVSGTIGEKAAAAAIETGATDYIAKGNLTRLVPAVERELLFRGLDGQEIEVGESSWLVQIDGVQTVDDHHWVQVRLDGLPSYPLTLKMPHTADAIDATRALRRWLLSPEKGEGGVIAVSSQHRQES
jgi:CheY-like chemotaxis protein